ncbi:MAG: MFS transporter, partial [Dehalococcoidia bacterium]|nr:MFS transporter [Dehalococcoidia bacterium]
MEPEVNMRKIEYKWVITGVACFTMLMSSGIRQSFSAFLTPMQAEFGTGRAPLALAMSIGLLAGALCQPVVGKLSDSLGARRVLAVGCAITGAGLLALGFAPSLLVVYAIFGLVLAVGFSASGVIPNAALVTRWFVEHRAFALSIASAGFSMGQVVLLPAAAYLIALGGWRFAYWVFGMVFFAAVLPIVLLLARDDPGNKIPSGQEVKSQGPAVSGDFTSIRAAMKTSSFWKLLATFGVCGFTGGLVYTHIIPFALDAGVPATEAANVLAVAGSIGVVGSIAIASLSDRVGRKNPLAA